MIFKCIRPKNQRPGEAMGWIFVKIVDFQNFKDLKNHWRIFKLNIHRLWIIAFLLYSFSVKNVNLKFFYEHKIKIKVCPVRGNDHGCEIKSNLRQKIFTQQELRNFLPWWLRKAGWPPSRVWCGGARETRVTIAWLFLMRDTLSNLPACQDLSGNSRSSRRKK